MTKQWLENIKQIVWVHFIVSVGTSLSCCLWAPGSRSYDIITVLPTLLYRAETFNFSQPSWELRHISHKIFISIQCNFCEICFYCCCAFLGEMSNWISSSRCALNLIYTKLLQKNSLLILTVNPVYWMGITSQLLPKMVGTHPRPSCAHHTGTGSLLQPATGTGQSLKISGASVLCRLWLSLKWFHGRFPCAIFVI